MVDNILSQVLYGISGFLFGIFAVRCSVKATARLKEAKATQGMGLGFLLRALPSLVFFLFVLFIFPPLLYVRTPIGGFIYLATFVFFTMKVRAKK